MAKNETSILGTGMLSAALGYCTLLFMPGAALFGWGAIAAGAWCLWDAMRNYSDFDRLWDALRITNCGEKPKLKHKTRKDGYTVFEFTIPVGKCVDDFTTSQLEIEQFLGKDIDISYGYKSVIIKVFDDNNAFKSFQYQPVKPISDMSVYLGNDRFRKPVFADLTDNIPHMLVAGQTGCGKSTALRAILTNLILESDVELYLGDMKRGVEFQLFQNCRNVVGYATDEDSMMEMLRQAHEEMDRRLRLFESDGCNNIDRYNSRHKQKLRRQLIAIDEYADVHESKPCAKLMMSIARLSRCAGIHLIVATQRPDKNVLDQQVKGNMGHVLGMTTRDEKNSNLIIGHEGLERLHKDGHAVYCLGLKEIELQCPNLQEERTAELLEPYYKAKANKQIVSTKTNLSRLEDIC